MPKIHPGALRGRCAAVAIVTALALAAPACKKEAARKPVDRKMAEGAGGATGGTEQAPPPDADRQPTTSGPGIGDLNKVGKVSFPTACDQKAQPDFERAVALLHSFFYVAARNTFQEVTKADPNCAIAYWGEAMTWYHPVWAAPTDQEVESGRKAIEAAQKATTKNDRDKMLIDALAAFFAAAPAGKAEPTAVGMTCHGASMTHPERAKAYSAAMKAAHDKFADDDEVAAFYALSLLGAAPSVDPTLKNQKAAAEILEKLWARHKDHPGVAHYLIHAYDYPPLAQKGLTAAKEYAAIAPVVPHALHMPSHIFVRLGMWNEAIDSNLASADAARAYGAQTHPGDTTFEELHALDYLTYAYLQTGQDSKAQEVATRVTAVKKTFPEVDPAAAYAVGAIPARVAVERHQWKEAAALQVPDHSFWGTFPQAEAHLVYARGLGQARSGDAEGAKKSLARLTELRDAIKDPKVEYFKHHVDLQIQAVGAWIAAAEGKKDVAARALAKAADMEDKLGKHPVSPGPILPIREQLGDLYLDMKKPADALKAYQAALVLSPRRFNALYGAGHAAQLAKKQKDAVKYFEELVAVAGGGDTPRPELAEAKQAVGK